MSDRQIIELLQQCDERGIEEAERLYGNRLLRIAERLLPKEDAEECVNDVFLALWHHVPDDQSSSLMRYLITILKNLVRNRWRTQKTLKRQAEMIPISEDININFPDPQADTEGEAILRASDIINCYLEDQNQAKRKMFILRYWYSVSIKEIAERHGYSYAKVERTLHRMKKDIEIKIKGE